VSKNIPVKIEFGGVDNVSPIFGTINLRLGNLNKQMQKTNEIAEKINFKAKIIAIDAIVKNLKQYSDAMSASAKSTIHDISNIEDNVNRLGILLHRKGDTKFFDDQKKQWRELSEISTHTQSEISDVAKEIVNAGVHSEKDLNALTNLSLKLADASKNDLSSLEAFTTINEFKNTYKIKAEDLPILTDKIVYGKDQGTASYHDILEGFKYAAPVLSAVTNAKPDEFLALNAVLANHGIKGSNLGTALRRLPVQLIPKMNAKFLKKLEKSDGKNVADIVKGMSGGHNQLLKMLGLTADKITDKETGKIDMSKALILIRDNLKKYTPLEQTGLVKQLFGQEAISTGMTLKEFLNDYFEKLEKIKNKSVGKADELSKSTRNTLESKLTQTKNAWDNFKISVMQSGVDKRIGWLADHFKKMLQYLDEIDPKFKRIIGATALIGYGFIEVNAKLMPLLLNLYIIHGLLTSAKVITYLGLIRNLIKAVAMASWSWAASILTNPLTWIILGIIAAFTALIFTFRSIILHWNYLKIQSKKDMDFIRDYVKKFTDDLAGFFEHPIDAMKKLFNHLKEFGKYGLKSNIKILKVLTGIDEDDTHDDERIIKEEETAKAGKNFFVPDYMLRAGIPGKSEINLNINNAPEGSKVIQKTKDMPPIKIQLGQMGAALL
jgi:TP901 family phage tail tape measure protein